MTCKERKKIVNLRLLKETVEEKLDRLESMIFPMVKYCVYADQEIQKLGGKSFTEWNEENLASVKLDSDTEYFLRRLSEESITNTEK